MNLEEKYKELQKRKQIIIECNKEVLEISDNLDVIIEYNCGAKEKIPLLKILNFPQDYYELLFGDVIFQKRLNCKKHCKRSLHYTKLKPIKSESDIKKIWNLEHGRTGYADVTIRLATPAPTTSITTEIA